MQPIQASKLCIVEGVEEDPRTRARAERLRACIKADVVEHVDDERLEAIAAEEIFGRPRQRHGEAGPFRPLVILNRFRFEDSGELRAARQARLPHLFKNPTFKLQGYGGFEWRESGSAEQRAKTGLVCQPAWQLHTIVGCPFRCGYCHLGHFYNIMLNLEDFAERLDGETARAPGQKLYQYDNWTDTVCFEPEYGGSKRLIEYFARSPDKYLELYVGKSDHVDFLLDYAHRGHTVCCWSLAGRTQCTRIERGTAPMEARIAAARRCQQAGYPVRVRFSPIIPVRNWRAENREMIERLFAEVRPDVVTFESIRFLDYDELLSCFGAEVLDEEFLQVMKAARGQPRGHGCEVPEAYRLELYRFIAGELERVSPRTPYAICRGKRSLWEALSRDFARHGQQPDRYVCNCGPYSAPGHPLLCNAAACAKAAS